MPSSPRKQETSDSTALYSILAAGALLAGGVLCYYFNRSSAQSSTDRHTVLSDACASSLERERLIDILTRVHKVEETTLTRLLEMMCDIRAKVGIKISRQELATFTRENFQKILNAAESKVYESNDTTPEEVKQAADALCDDVEVAALMQKITQGLKALYKETELPSDCTADKFLEYRGETSRANAQALVDAFKETKALALKKGLGTKTVEFQTEMKARQVELKKQYVNEIRAKYGWNLQVVCAAGEKYFDLETHVAGIAHFKEEYDQILSKNGLRAVQAQNGVV